MSLDGLKNRVFGDEFNLGILFMVIIGLVAGVILTYYTFVAGTEIIRAQASSYWTLIIFAILIYGTFRMLSDAGKLEDFPVPLPILYNRKVAFNMFEILKIEYTGHVLMLLIPLLVGSFLFFSVAETPTMQILQAPTFQFVELSGAGNAMLTISSSISEDFYFWVGIYGLIFAPFFLFFAYITKLPVKYAFGIALTLTILITPFVWLEFHSGRYSLSDVITSDKLLFFGFLSAVWIGLFRNVSFIVIIHALNNLALYIWRIVSIGNPMFYFWFIAIIMIAISIGLIWKHYKETGEL